ncbi:MAG TPA: ribonuclease HII [Thermoflexales bacterium]|nr:ribonuclease HII [Thermoflexales bacterium]HQZ98743.1 ribonuclease HII [Thermoflexales bacterium]
MPSLLHENELRSLGHALVAGVDEAGRGAWAGPVMAAAVILPPNADQVTDLRGVNDSKKLSATQRERCREAIERLAVAYAIGQSTNSEIDTLGIVPATRLAMARAIAALPVKPHALLIDAVKLREVDIFQRSFNFADSISLSVAAASILAKTERDRTLRELAAQYPAYGFDAHKGYGTRKHAAALAEFGPASVHRMSFAPLKIFLTAETQRR